MPDLYLQALLQGEFIKKGIQSKKAQKNRFEEEIDKQIDAYLETQTFDDTPQNALATPAMKRAKMKAEMRAESRQTELSKYIEIAFKIVFEDALLYLSKESFASLNTDFELANQHLKDLDLNLPTEENFQAILRLSDQTIESIGSIALSKFEENRFSESIALYILLATLTPENPEHWYRAAISAHTDNQPELALRLYHAASTLDEELIGAKIFSIDCYIKLRLLAEAKTTYYEIKHDYENIEVGQEWMQMLEELEKIVA